MRTYLEKKNILFLNSIRNIIDLDPLFQRGKVWPVSKQELFIDTIIKNWGVPKIYLAAYKDNKGNIYKYECIDGKQRLISIFDFFDNKFPVLLDTKKTFFKDTSVNIKEKIGIYNLDIEIVEDFKEDELPELFQRLQLGLVLNTSEKLKATPGEMSEFIIQISNTKLFKNKIISKAKRYPHIATVAQISLLSMKNDIVDLKYNHLLKFIKTYSKFNKNGNEAKKIKKIITYIDQRFDANDARIVFKTRAMFVSCFYLILYLMIRGDLSKLKIKEFFLDFINKLNTENKDSDIKDFQISFIQSPDSSTSIKRRHEVLLKRLIKWDKNVADLVNYTTLSDEFENIYTKKLTLFDNHTQMNSKLVNIGCKTIKLKNGTRESLPTYIRHKNVYPNNKNRTYTPLQIDMEYSIKFLKKILNR